MNDAALASLVDIACRAIAPSWPLDRQIAVNPYWGFVDRPFAQVAQTIRRLTGGRMTLAPTEYLQAWNAGEITPGALTQALAEHGLSISPESAVGLLTAARTSQPELPLLSDILDQDPDRAREVGWRGTITQQVSQYCASYFDERQADWHRAAGAGFFDSWRKDLEVDHALEPLMHAPRIRTRARALPSSADSALAWSLQHLGILPDDAADFLRVCLLRINGWASWCAYLRWEAELNGTTDSHLRELLAIRVSWEALLDDGQSDAGPHRQAWREQWSRARHSAAPPLDSLDQVWLRAHEISYQNRLIRQLNEAQPITGAAATSAQVVFCIDVRSERFRRALESADPSVDTYGFAGFFGLPIRYTPVGTVHPRPQLPGLLTASLDATDSTGTMVKDRAIVARRRRALDTLAAWQPFLRLPSGAFSLVETFGPGYLGAILKRHFGGRSTPVETIGLAAADVAALRPRLCIPDSESLARTADLAASILRAMGLTQRFARLLVLVGHGSQSENNPQAAALDCGACGGQTGDVNARVLAGLLNNPDIRAALSDREIHIPTSTVAIAAFHNTTTDEVQLYDLDQTPASHVPDLERLRNNFAEAGRRTRAERAPRLGLGALAGDPDVLLKRVRRRARDWAQTRPEWGLADNAAFIVAPRSRTRGLDLGGRTFLQTYTWTEDHDGTILELIMTAPMIVTHWINLQYHASTVDPERLGSGNKTLHNVACGRIGVFEGNTGDLRIGLSRQSVYDGTRRMHTPLRLSVFIDAPRKMIDAVLAQHAIVRQLVENRWLHLFRIGAGAIERRIDGDWEACCVSRTFNERPC